MWLKFKNVATIVIETFHLLLLTLILGNTFHALQIDDIVVMASPTTRTTTTVITQSASSPPPASSSSSSSSSSNAVQTTLTAGAGAWAGARASATLSLSSLSTLPLPQSPPSTAATSLWQEEELEESATNAGKLLNLTPNTADAITDSNEIDTMIKEYEEGYLDKNYVMAKHIALSDEAADDADDVDDATRLAAEPAATPTNEATISTKLISAPASQPSTLSSPAVALVTPSMSTATRHRHSSPAATTASLVNHRFYANKTRLDDLSSLSLLSLNDTSAELQISTSSTAHSHAHSHSPHAPPSSSSSAANAPSQATRPIHAATVLRVKGNEQNMHNTNSHLTVDNVNATIVVSGSGTGEDAGNGGGHNTKTASANIPAAHHHHYHHNTTSTAAGRNHSSNSSNSSNSSSSTSISIDSSDAFMAASGNIGGGGGIGAGGGSKINGTGTTRISARKVEHKHILPKSHKTDAPMLNYIFDTFSSANKHHHHDQRYGPHFEDVQLVGKPTNMTVQAGSSIHLNCRISLLQDKTVSWVRRNPEGENALDLLTVGLHAYTGDKRYKMEFQYPNNWRLKIVNVKKDDEATYECQISTHPPRVIQINLHVNAPKVMIVDEFGDPLQEKYYEQDSTLQLSCVVRNVAMSTSVVFWKHSEDVLNYDVTRGGISVKTELMDDGANSTLFIAKINKADSGNYTCSISEYQNYTIVVHILNGESFAELHHGSAICWHRPNHQSMAINLIVLATMLLLLPAYINR